MKLLRLILRNALRNKRRTILTVGSIAAGLAIFVFLRTIITLWAEQSDVPESAKRLVVRNKVSLAAILPERHAEKIKKIPGVEICHPYHWVGAKVKDQPGNMFVQQFACDKDTFFDVWSELKVDDDVRKAWREDKTCALVGSKTMKALGIEKGKRFILEGTIYPCDLELRCVGTFSGFGDDDTIFFRRDYLLDALKERYSERQGIVGTFYVKTTDPAFNAAVIKAIDDAFENSDAPTRTETEKDFIQGFVNMLGNVKPFFMSLAGAVLAAMLLILANTMAMAIRERTREIAIMKAIGFTPGSVLFLIVAEALFTSAIGGVVGCVGPRVLFHDILQKPNLTQFFPNFDISWPTVGIGFGIALAMGLFSGLVPAVRAARLEVVAGLRRLG